MAHIAALSALSGELITNITGCTAKNDPIKFDLLKEFTARSLNNHHFTATNPFDVEKQLDGLDEKLRILSADEVADALHVRRASLKRHGDKSTPDILSLLLQLSQRPAREAKTENLALLRHPDPLPPITWDEILASDPLTEDGIWENVDFAASSSEEGEFDLKSVSSRSGELHNTRVADASPEAGKQLPVVSYTDEGLIQLNYSQLWATETSRPFVATVKIAQPIYISEMQAIRESLFMVSGLPTALYGPPNPGAKFQPNANYKLRDISDKSSQDILQCIASIGTNLDQVRSWLKTPQTFPLLQMTKAVLDQRIHSLNIQLSKIQERFIAANENVVVSLLEINIQIEELTFPFLQLSELLEKLDSKTNIENRPFQFLELLFHQACLNQMVGDESRFRFIAQIFFDCFEVYLKLLVDWMVEGALQVDDRIFFIIENDKVLNTENASIWHDRYRMRQTADGRPFSPNFLHAAATKIFNAGKNVVFLKKLRIKSHGALQTFTTPKFDFGSVYLSHPLASLTPFSELFDVAMDKWIDTNHIPTSLTLRQHLYSDCGLWRSIDALENIYFRKDGARSSHISTTIFNKIDRGKEAWNDRFLLTELLQGSLGNISSIDASRLAVTTRPGRYGDVQNRRRSVRILSSISIVYNLPWPIANIIQPQSLASYSLVFIFLLQIERSSHILSRRLLKNSLSGLEGDALESDLYHSLRQRLLWLTSVLYAHFAQLVLSSAMAQLRIDMEAADDVDAMAGVHEAFVQRVLAQCLLTKKLAPLHGAVISLLDLGILCADAHAEYVARIEEVSIREVSMLGFRSPMKKRRVEDEEDEEDEGAEEGEADMDTSYISFQETAYGERLEKMHAQFDRLSAFLVAGLRGVARVEGEGAWEMLADKLEWKGKGRGRV
ncbi:MAG: hypothetical protein M1829_000220 [Trizodia sp. TS-e1964]|nr:MAG: hypothetical protein M1829_000220 [Trizodia sp. TS-e1964]